MAGKGGVKGLKGIDNVMRNLNKELAKMKVKSLAGLLQAAAIIRVDMDKTPPLIPIDTGNLRNSWFVTSGTTPKLGPFVIIGFSAIYAVAVHEMIGDINWNRPGSGGHFFISSLKRNRGLILRTVAKSIRF